MAQPRMPVMVVNTTPKTESARETQITNIDAAKTVADVIRSCLGPRAMLKMILRFKKKREKKKSKRNQKEGKKKKMKKRKRRELLSSLPLF